MTPSVWKTTVCKFFSQNPTLTVLCTLYISWKTWNNQVFSVYKLNKMLITILIITITYEQKKMGMSVHIPIVSHPPQEVQASITFHHMKPFHWWFVFQNLEISILVAIAHICILLLIYVCKVCKKNKKFISYLHA